MPFYDTTAQQRLKDKQAYELWLLNFLRTIKHRDDPHQVIKIVNGVHVDITARETLGAGAVEEVIKALYPLIFVSAYKLLDMLFEWILEEHQSAGVIPEVPWRFSEKINMIKKLDNQHKLRLPSIFITDQGLYDRFFALYDKMCDYRNAIIHASSFEISPTGLKITDREGNTISCSVVELFAFSHVVVTISRILQGEPLTTKLERSLRSHLDLLQAKHNYPAYGVAPPSGVIVEQIVEARATSTRHYEWELDMDRVWQRFKQVHPSLEDFEFRIRGTVSGEIQTTWLIPSELLPDTGRMIILEDDLKWRAFIVTI